MFKKFVLVISLIMVLSGAAAAQKISGAWRLDEVRMAGTGAQPIKFVQPNTYLFTTGHFSIIRIEGDQPRSTEEWGKMTRDQLVDTYIKQFSASSGTFEMKGNTLTMKTTLAKNPNFMARANWISYAVAIKGKTMTLTATATNEGPVKNPQIMTLTRLD